MCCELGLGACDVEACERVLAVRGGLKWIGRETEDEEAMST